MSRDIGSEETSGWIARANKRWYEERQGFLQVIRSEWLIILLGLLSGVGLILLQRDFSWFEDHASTALVFEHLGLGFIVSSIAVFGYEWRSHAKRVIELSKQLTKSVEDVERMRKTMVLSKAQVDVLTTKAEDALDCSLSVFIGEDWKNLREDLKLLVKAVSHIQQQPSWMEDRYLDVVQWLFRETVLYNTQSFETLNIEEAAAEPHFKVPTPGQMADKILATQMELMTEGDIYDVISDITSWRDNLLEEFSKKSVTAIQYRRVHVRRVFNLFRFRQDLPPPSDPSYQEMCQKTITTLEEHLRASSDFKPSKTRPGYELKIFGKEELAKLLKRVKGNPTFTKDKVMKAHFGLFRQSKNPKTVIRFNVESGDLSDIKLCCRPNLVNPDVTLFNAVWRDSSWLDKDKVIKIQEQLKSDSSGITRS